jgi:hypothetical protein
MLIVRKGPTSHLPAETLIRVVENLKKFERTGCLCKQSPSRSRIKIFMRLAGPKSNKKNVPPKMRLEVRARAITRVNAHLAMWRHTDIWLPFCGTLQTLLVNVLSS